MKFAIRLAVGALLVGVGCAGSALAQSTNPLRYEPAPQPDKTIGELKADLDRAFRRSYVFWQRRADGGMVVLYRNIQDFRVSDEDLSISFSNAEVFEKGLPASELEFTFRFSFDELAGLMRDGACSDPRSIDPKSPARDAIYFSGPRKINAVNFGSPEDFRAACDAMYNLGLRSADRQLQEEQRFNEKAALYRALKTKPQVGEAQRRLIVQANSLTKARDFGGALERYRELVAEDPVIYPTAYSNMGLLAAELKDYRLAVRYMKRYLALVPNAPDARAVQDQIYEWEVFIKR